MTRIKIIIMVTTLVFCELSFAVQTQDATAVNDRDINVRIFEDVQYPPLAYMARIQGVVTVQLRLDEQGSVVKAVATSGPELLVDGSVNSAKRWVFMPNSAKAAVIVYSYKILDGRCNKNASLFILQGRNLATVLACPPIVNESSSR